MPGITPIADVPDAPTIGAATDVGTARAYNNGSATVAYTAAATGGAVTTFTATSTPGSFTATGASPITVTGLQSATAYTFKVSAANSSGTLASSSSSSITATTVPQAPTIGTFTDGGTGTTGTLSFTVGATGGSSITNYKVSTDNSTYTALSPSQTSSPLSLSGLSVGTATYYIKAVNANGDSTASSGVSGTVLTPSSFYNIATQTVSVATASITFSSIPSTYKSLQIRSISKDTDATYNGFTSALIRFNGVTNNSNYAFHRLNTASGSVVAYGAASSQIEISTMDASSGTGMTNIYAGSIIDIIDYASTSKNKTVRYIGGFDNNSTGGGISLVSGLFMSTSAISSITIASNDIAWAIGSTFALYGIN
jgi:hypothetical protein